MNNILDLICNSLEDLSISILNGYESNKTMTEVWGWNCAPLSRHDLSNLALNLSNRIKENNIESIDNTLIESLNAIPDKIIFFKKTTLPYFYNGNAATSVPVYISLIGWISATLEPIYGWQTIQDNKAMPNQLAKKLRSIKAELSEILPEKEDLKNQIQIIQEATSAAESLPVDLESLKEARIKISKISSDSSELYGKIDSYQNNSAKIFKVLSDKTAEADKLVSLCEEAYKITTTKGLAAAFDQRANKLSQTMWIWVFGLLLSLVLSVIIGSHRFGVLEKSLQRIDPQWGIIWVDIVLSIVSLAAPVWFAWLATKQINQCFRLSEDYSFKASVAKAYEGYRREAARIDESFEARLFSSALTRLEEAPLRLVENNNHGSPWHEFFASSSFQKALDTIPDLKDQFIVSAKKGMTNLKSKVSTKDDEE